MAPLPLIQVAGDLTADWASFDASGDDALSHGYQWDRESDVGVSVASGAAALLTELLASCSPELFTVDGWSLPANALSDPRAPNVTRTLSRWSPHPRRRGERSGVWRVREFAGVLPAEDPLWPPAPSAGTPDCLVLDDANLGFRDRPGVWPGSLQTGAPPRHIIVKMTNPLAAGPLWDLLAGRHANRLTVVLAENDLRKEGAPIGQPLSWEQLATDVARTVLQDPRLSAAARVVVGIGLAGAVIVESGESPRLVFDPLGHDTDWRSDHPGQLTGIGTCLTAALAIAAASRPEQPDWVDGVRRGLGAGRALWEHGYALDPARGLVFPAVVGETLAAPADAAQFAGTTIDPESDSWTILDIRTPGALHHTAEEIVRRGPDEALPGVPVERFGQWSSVDRTEIETMRSIRLLVEEYLSLKRPSRPLSLAVFGSPGSGKSFGVKQLTQAWSAGHAVTILEFNLTQLEGPGDLVRAFERVRDVTVTEALPVVFWDEFDSPRDGQPMGWLKLFLAPMQDGGYSEGGAFHPLGPAVFVFAGGVFRSMDRFKDAAAADPATKATDFLSRLRGYVDILGVNASGPEDRHVTLRRAFLLRSVLQRRAPQLIRRGSLAIDPGVLRAFLNVAEYLHGARSLEAIVDMSSLGGKLRFERSSLPPQHQLNLHTDAAQFLALVRGD